MKAITPPNPNVSAEHWWLEDVISFKIPFLGDMVIFAGVSLKKTHHWANPINTGMFQ